MSPRLSLPEHNHVVSTGSLPLIEVLQDNAHSGMTRKEHMRRSVVPAHDHERSIDVLGHHAGLEHLQERIPVIHRNGGYDLVQTCWHSAPPGGVEQPAMNARSCCNCNGYGTRGVTILSRIPLRGRMRCFSNRGGVL